MAYSKKRNGNPFTSGGPGNGKKKRPAVTTANTAKYTDWEKKEKALHGVGAKKFSSNTPEGKQQEGRVAGKVTQYKKDKNEWPTKQSQIKHGLSAMDPVKGQYAGSAYNVDKKNKKR